MTWLSLIAQIEPTLEQIEKEYAAHLLAAYNYNRAKVACALGISPQSLQYRLKRLGLHNKNPMRQGFRSDLYEGTKK